MGRIHILAPGLANRIAAGECVERPASVIKELVENALDAGALQIDITIEEGGRDRITVVDDGCGMDRDDLALCIASHATSKISADADLFDIRTLGFRGEALPSIASVARVQIVSRPAQAEIGHELRIEAGEVRGPTPCAAPPGTRVEVRDLFFSVPARRKFLRTNATESGQVTEQLARIALPHHAAGFTLRSAGRWVHRLPAVDDRLQRIRDFYGADLADGLLPVSRQADGLALHGYVAPPALCRPSGKWEYVFVNGRCVRDRFVSHAVREAYRSLIQNEFPVVFLYLEIDPGAVDVNVHPTKSEVRWRDSNFVHHFVLSALRDKFLTTNLDRPFQLRERGDEAYRERVRAAMVDFFTGSGAEARRREGTAWRGDESLPASRSDATRSSGAQVIGAAGNPPARVPDPDLEPISAPDLSSDHESAIFGNAGPAAETSRPEAAPRLALQIHNTYLLIETDEGLLIVDQHALHERILYEELRTRIAQRPLQSQRLLLPDVVHVPPDRIEALELHADTLNRLGIELTAAGPQSIAVQAFPMLLDRADRPAFVRDLLDRLAERGTRLETESLVHDLLDMMACKAAVKAGDPLTQEEMTALLERRNVAERSSHCPHGRPTTLHISLGDLERQFKRR